MIVMIVMIPQPRSRSNVQNIGGEHNLFSSEAKSMLAVTYSGRKALEANPIRIYKHGFRNFTYLIYTALSPTR